MKPPITAAQAMSHPVVFETVNSLGKMADELCAKVDALTKERDKLAEQVSLLKTANEVLAEKLAADGKAQQAAVPMTDEQIDEIALQEGLLLICDDFDALKEITRAVEAHHGIGAKQ